MKPFIILIAVFTISIFAIKLLQGKWDFSFSGRIAMAVMLIFTAIGHFAFSKGMTLMMPNFLPFKLTIVYFTGVLEILFAIGLLIPASQKIIAWSLIAFFILLLPMNILAAIKQVNIQTGELNGPGLSYLWFRIPLQVLFILWIYFSAIKTIANGDV